METYGPLSVLHGPIGVRDLFLAISLSFIGNMFTDQDTDRSRPESSTQHHRERGRQFPQEGFSI